MSIETGIYKLLSADPTVSAQVGTRITPVIVPEGSSFPAISYHWVDRPRWGALDNPTGTPHARLQVTCWSQTFAGAIALCSAVKAALAGYSGLADDTTVQSITVIDERDLWEWEISSSGLYRRDIDFEI